MLTRPEQQAVLAEFYQKRRAFEDEGRRLQQEKEDAEREDFGMHAVRQGVEKKSPGKALPDPSATERKQICCRVQLGIQSKKIGSNTQYELVNALLDSGAAESIIKRSVLPDGITLEATKPRVWNTDGGSFQTDNDAKVVFQLPQFSTQRVSTWKFNVRDDAPGDKGYDAIIGRDLLTHLGMDLKFKTGTIEWEELELPMGRRSGSMDQQAIQRPAVFKPADYEEYHLPDCVPKHLAALEQELLLELLEAFRDLFQGKLGLLPGPPLDLEMVPGFKPVYQRPYPVPRSQLPQMKQEVRRMEMVGILKQIMDSAWGSPSFPVPKPNGSMRFITDLRAVNKGLVRKPYPLPRIQDIFQSIDGFTYASAIDFNMGFYHILLSLAAQKICTTVLPWGKYAYQRLPMGLSISPDVFQARMNTIFGSVPGCIVYIDDLLVITKGTFEEHLETLRQVFQLCRQNNIQVNAKKSHFFAPKLEYLGLILSAEGIRADPKKVEAIQKIEVPRTRKALQSFLGMTNFLRASIPQYSKYSSPLTTLTSSKKTFKWTNQDTKAFEALKRQVMKACLLAFSRLQQGI